MDIGIPKEVADLERRVALTPRGVHRLVQAGHRVYVQCAAGRASHFEDKEYQEAGAQPAYEAEEVFGRADLLLKVAAPSLEEYGLLRAGQTLFCFLHPVVAPPEGFRTLLRERVAAVAMELIEDERERLPILEVISEIAGAMAIQIAAHLLESGSGGRGILLGGAPGIPPATVVILGAGAVGNSAARTALGSAAQVIVLDNDLRQLNRLDRLLDRRVVTMIADSYNISRAVQFADVLIGAVLVRGGRTPHLVTEAMVRSMKHGSVIVDLSIDQGGCVETIRPTTLKQPTFVVHHVVHYAVPNLTANVARMATFALTNATLPFVLNIADQGLRGACLQDRGLMAGLVVAEGHCFKPLVADQFNTPVSDAGHVLREEDRSDDSR